MPLAQAVGFLEQVIHCGGRRVPHSRYDVAVGVGRDGDGQIPEHLAHKLGVCTTH